MANKRKVTVQAVVAGAMLAVAVVLASFSHTAFPVAGTSPSGFDDRAYAAQYALPDGTLPVLCGTTQDGQPHHPSAVPCEFCLIAGGSALIIPDIEVTIGFPTVVLSKCTGLDIASASRPLYRVLAPTRAPPLA